MKKIIRILISVLLIIPCAFVFFACGNNPEQLSTPVINIRNPYVNSEGSPTDVSWYPGNSNYDGIKKSVVCIDENTVEIPYDSKTGTGFSYNLSYLREDNLTTPKIHKIKVMLKGDGKKKLDSEWSEEKDFIIRALGLSEPTNLAIIGTTITWDEVENAMGYRVYVSEKSNAFIGWGVEVTALSYSLAYITDPDEYIVRVVAISDYYYDSIYSSIDYVVS